MTIEDRLQASLHARADSIVPNEPEWDRIANRAAPTKARPHRRRWVAAGLLAAAGVVAAVLAVGLARTTSTRVTTSAPSPTSVPPPTTPPTTSPPTTAAAAAVPGPPDGPVPPGFSPLSVTWTSTNDGWVLGTTTATTPTVIRTRDGGRTWHGIATPSLSGDFIRFADTRNGWIFGQDAWATHDGGSSWHKVTQLGSAVRSLEASAGSVYAVVVQMGGETAAHLFAAPTGSDDWTQLAADPLGLPMIALHDRTGFVAGTDGALRSFSRSGLQRRGNPCAAAASPSAVAAVSDSQVAALCVTDPGAGSSTKTLMVSADGARTWSVAGTAPRGGQPDALAAASPTTFVVGAASGASYLYRTIDGGHSWATVYSDNATGGAPLVDVGFTDSLHGVAVLAAAGQSQLLVTSDAGATWSPARLR